MVKGARSSLIAPDVSVVVIAFNDAQNLPRAIQSVLNQTLANLEIIVVDDASTDGTAEVADALAREHTRLRAVHLEENSGGCSKPRNVGLKHARAPYVMFLDSDDVLERHACKNLLSAAECEDADVVAGLAERVQVKRRRSKKWYGWLYDERAVYDSIDECPDLLYDTLCTNKLYRREFLDGNEIRFPEGFHYEDLLFTTEVYCAARRIVAIPNLVYQWMVVEDSENPSISNRRHLIENFEHRLAIHRKIDAFLDDHDKSQLKPVKDRKFLRHDLRLYLYELPKRDAEYQQALLELAAEYLETIDVAMLDEIEPIDRVCYFLVRQRVVPELLSVVDYLIHGRRLTADLVERDGRVYWCERFLDTEEGRRLLDVTTLGWHRRALPQMSLGGRVERLDVRGSTVSLVCEIVNPLGVVGHDDEVSVELCTWTRDFAQRDGHPAGNVEVRHRRVRFMADLDLAAIVRDAGRRQRRWFVGARLTCNGEWTMVPLSVQGMEFEGQEITVHPKRWLLLGTRMQPFATGWDDLAFRFVDPNRPRRLAQRGVRRWRRSRPYKTAKRLRRSFSGPRARRIVYNAAQRLPVHKGTVVFESHMGKQYSDSPKYIYEALRRRELPFKLLWSFSRNRAGFPSEAKTVRRNSLRYCYALARAEYWVDNQGLPRQYSRRRETTYIQTWHGTPLKLMGFDEPRLAALEPAAKAEQQAMVDRWSALLVPSEYFIETFARSYNYRGKLVRSGMPRNDLLVSGGDPETVAAIKRRLQLPLDKKIVLYAPTFREEQRILRGRMELHLDLDEMMAGLADDYFLAVRGHYLDSVRLAHRHHAFASDVSGHHDVTELMLAADVLITDYSSVMFDFANTKRPMIFFAYDYDKYMYEERGAYFDLAEVAPGPVVGTTEEVIDALRDIEAVRDSYTATYEEFVARFCEYETGKASETVVDEFFSGAGK